MIIRGHEVDLTDAALCFALPDGSVHAATLKELDAWRSAREAEQFGLDLPVIDPTDPSAVVDANTVQAIFADY